MFTKKELQTLDKINPDQKFLNSKAGFKSTMKGLRDALKDSEY